MLGDRPTKPPDESAMAFRLEHGFISSQFELTQSPRLRDREALPAGEFSDARQALQIPVGLIIRTD